MWVFNAFTFFLAKAAAAAAAATADHHRPHQGYLLLGKPNCTVVLNPGPTTAEADRYFTLLKTKNEYLLFSRKWLHSGKPQTMAMYRGGDGVTFDLVSRNVIVGDSATNTAVFARAGEILAVGGRSGNPNHPSHRGLGVVGIRAFQVKNDTVESLFDGDPVLQGDSGKCFEGRKLFNNHCEFDGRLSMVWWKGRYWMYGRANLDLGIRYVQVTRSTDMQNWGDWRLLDIHGYRGSQDQQDYRDVNVYFLGVHLNPFDPEESLLGLLPLNDPTHPDPDLRAAICLTFSRDGVHWSSLIPLFPSTPIEQRTFDHPAIGLVTDNSSMHFYIHRDVPHISTRFRASRIERFSVPLNHIQKLYLDAVLQLDRDMIKRNLNNHIGNHLSIY